MLLSIALLVTIIVFFAILDRKPQSKCRILYQIRFPQADDRAAVMERLSNSLGAVRYSKPTTELVPEYLGGKGLQTTEELAPVY
jgi:hypothetical protein